jgi:hypothetical protein
VHLNCPGYTFQVAPVNALGLFKERQKANRGPRLTPEGLRPQHPQSSGKRKGNDQQHGTRTAMREDARNCAPGQKQMHAHQQADSDPSPRITSARQLAQPALCLDPRDQPACSCAPKAASHALPLLVSYAASYCWPLHSMHCLLLHPAHHSPLLTQAPMHWFA